MFLDPILAAWIAHNPAILWLPRLLMVWMFLESALDKYRRFGFFTREAHRRKIPFPGVAIGLAMLTEIMGSLSLFTGLFVVAAMVTLSFYVFALNLIYFDFWDFTGETAIADRKQFLKNLAVAGGLIALAQASLLLGHNH